MAQWPMARSGPGSIIGFGASAAINTAVATAESVGVSLPPGGLRGYASALLKPHQRRRPELEAFTVTVSLDDRKTSLVVHIATRKGQVSTPVEVDHLTQQNAVNTARSLARLLKSSNLADRWAKLLKQLAADGGECTFPQSYIRATPTRGDE